MKEIGRVVSAKGKRILVEVERSSACSRCGRCGGHITFGDKTLTVEAACIGKVVPGDLVELEIPDSDYLKLSFFMYIFPLISGAIGYGIGWFLGNILGNGPLWAGLFAIGALAFSFLWLRQYDLASEKTDRYLPLARPLVRKYREEPKQ